MRVLIAAVVLVGGCWQEDLVDGVFTHDEWAYIETFKQPDMSAWSPCKADPRVLDCLTAVRLGRQLFYDDGYSAPNRVACATCHRGSWFVDSRSKSTGAGTTLRNTQSLVNIAFRELEPESLFTWTGAFKGQDLRTLESVLVLPMRSDAALHTTPRAIVARVVTAWWYWYEAAFGPIPHVQAGRPPFMGMYELVDVKTVLENVELAFAAYERTLVSGPSPFDLYIGGPDGEVADPGQLDDAAKRGLKLFVGAGLCTECHGGWNLEDGAFHNTGVADDGTPDPGRHGEGQFRTPSLRNVAVTAPYMHNGRLQTLAQVLDFYRWGGDDRGFVGAKDDKISPLPELTDDDLRDLEAFLDSLTGTPPVDVLP